MVTDACLTKSLSIQTGQPKGTTHSVKREKKERIELCKMVIVKEAWKVRQEHKTQGKHTKNFFSQPYQRKKKEFGLGDDITNSIKTIQN